MKKIIAASIILFAAAAQAQIVTNVAVRVTIEVVNPFISTNTVQTTLNLSAAVNKEKVMLDGLSWLYDEARKQGATNEYSFFLARTVIKDAIKQNADDYNRSRAIPILQDISVLLTTDIDLLNQNDIDKLAEIAAKAP